MLALRYCAMKNDKFGETFLTSSKEWRKLDQFEVIMRPVMLLCFDFQFNQPDISGEIPLDAIELKINYLSSVVCEVTDTDAKKDWVADMHFSRLPRIKMTKDLNRETYDAS